MVGFRSTGLLGQDETGTNPDGGSSESKGSSERLAVEQTTSSNNLDRLTGHGALPALDQLGNSRDKNGGGDVTGVTTAFTTLSANDIGTGIKGLVDMLGVTNHVHVENAGFVELLDNGLGGDTDGADEKLSTALDNNVDEFIKLSLGVVVAGKIDKLVYDLLGKGEYPDQGKTYLVLRALPPTWGSKRSTPNGAFLSVK